MPNAAVTVLIADDHPTFRDGLARLLETSTDFKVVGTARDGEDAIQLVAQLDPDILLLDLAMPRMAGLVALRELRDRWAAEPRATRKHFGLTPREIEIVGAVVGGASNGNIANSFAISEKTVKHHLTNIFDKLGVSNRLELALFAVHHKIGIGAPAHET